MHRVCAGCGCRYAAGAPCCPECRSTLLVEDAMPKITVAGGPSSALGQEAGTPAVPEDAAPPEPAAPAPAPKAAPSLAAPKAKVADG